MPLLEAVEVQASYPTMIVAEAEVGIHLLKFEKNKFVLKCFLGNVKCSRLMCFFFNKKPGKFSIIFFFETFR